ncbi:RdgB/HAM1 family non-canonical purine NTP pyrophosphatase [Pseudooceanicola sp.]|uniref:RdgB/HAM1 family non-canonical purine NTP pyrophosphatase n=1 Tax=Pseudooceanicola sp. TaxID=1914328 RepID=UPI00261EDA1A|nr:RdgB/HAM1 family non-canonical purine NTP pyrophosphatase [Pseudooceanicola sp.]MDF1854960.1 RdgB/HAM1 family non-canonical purine NTP pyrophosphatase [Pseudooceanicola sp.]
MRRFSGDRLIIASHNSGKLREIAALLAPYGVTVSSAAEHGLEEPEETEDTFAANARIKAHFAAKATGLPALSDDSGITVAALDGAPGVYTADWAETPKGRDFTMAMTRVWDLLEAKAAPLPRRAAFHCTLCLAWPDGHDEIFEGVVEGQYVWPMRGTRGFGFDPVFQPDGESETFGEMTPERKLPLTHRTRAFEQLVAACFD